MSRTGIIGERRSRPARGGIVVATGGTSDIPVAEEAAVTAEVLGNEVLRLYDVGVSGIHRLLSHMEDIMSARVIVAVAGMEGALPSVIGGACRLPCYRGADERGLWRVPRRHCGAAEYAQLLRERRVGREYRQRLRRGLYGKHDKPP